MSYLLSTKDMAKIGCRDCEGCSACCRDMGQSILLDPYDVFLLEKHIGLSFEKMMGAGIVELHVEEGLITPNMKMSDAKNACYFLNEEGRCSIHSIRPGICRLFPLGRDYTEGKLQYFVLEDACPAKNKTKVKIEKWLEMQQPAVYQNFLMEWHTLKKKMYQWIAEHVGEEDVVKKGNLLFLQLFYLKSYDEEFFGEWKERKKMMQDCME